MMHAKRVTAVLPGRRMTCTRRVSSTGDTIFSDNLSENFARTVRLGRSNAEEEAKNDQEAEAGGDCPLSRPTAKARGEAANKPPTCSRRERAQARRSRRRARGSAQIARALAGGDRHPAAGR